jgi:hypothetical protein
VIEARSAEHNTAVGLSDCAGCGGSKQAPIVCLFSVSRGDGLGMTIALCQECGRDAANAIGFMCTREGGWSKLEPRKKPSH